MADRAFAWPSSPPWRPAGGGGGGGGLIIDCQDEDRACTCRVSVYSFTSLFHRRAPVGLKLKRCMCATRRLCVLRPTWTTHNGELNGYSLWFFLKLSTLSPFQARRRSLPKVAWNFDTAPCSWQERYEGRRGIGTFKASQGSDQREEL